jgi:hypothetical protein
MTALAEALRRTYMRASRLLVIPFFLFSTLAHAGKADVLKVEVKKTTAGLYQFEVTVSHADEGWEHYADKWDVLSPDGTVLGTRTLFHPHVDEQPFTRYLVGVKVPEGVNEVTVRAHDLVHGYGGKSVTVAVPH